MRNKESNLTKKFETTFYKAYDKLNTQQKAAVDTTEGPIMVIAGPGTGKTQILAVRIGKILKEKDLGPHNILCLTFTDAAAYAMRKRLLEIIGPTAHQLHIFTFHSFCNQIIQENPEIFGNQRQLDVLSDLEAIDIFTQILVELPKDHLLKKLKGEAQYEIPKLRNLFQVMKKENLDPKNTQKIIEDYLQKQHDSSDMHYKRKSGENNKGDLNKNKWNKLKKQMDTILAASKLYDRYNQLLTKMGRFDYQDMLLWVIIAFKNHPDLLADYQERYQYFLVDEFQDTNGAQKDVLQFLIDYWNEPNVFVVGDDDQAIYRFQGADLTNVDQFKSRYKPHVVVLENNYRSNQQILDASKSLIKNNYKDESSGTQKKLIASLPDRVNCLETPSFNVYENILAEEAQLAHEITEAFNFDKDLSDTAILYRSHKQVERLIKVMETRGIPINVKRRVDILTLPLIKNILTILNYLNDSYNKPRQYRTQLFEMMHFNFFGISASDAAKVAFHSRELTEPNSTIAEKVEIRESVTNQMFDLMGSRAGMDSKGVSDPRPVLELHNLLSKWTTDIPNVTLQVLFQNVLNEGHILQYVLAHSSRTWLLQVVTTFFDLIKDESTKSSDVTLKSFLAMIKKMKDNRIKLEVNKVISSAKGAQFMTAHGSKGLEFDKVYIPGVVKDKWEKQRSGGFFNYSYPPEMNSGTKTDEADERRLMYVAMTRAKRHLEISHAVQDEKGKHKDKSQFIDEVVLPASLQVSAVKADETVIARYMADNLIKGEEKVKLLDKDLLDRVLDNYVMSVTGLNKYMRCPLSFYFEDILRVPTARTKHMGFGKAIHEAFEKYYRDISNDRPVDLSSILKYFEVSMTKYSQHFTPQELEDMTAHGLQVLPGYFDENIKHEVLPASFEMEAKIKDVHHRGVPIKGVLDKVAMYKDYVLVTDFKTGNSDSPKNKSKLKEPSDNNPLGGDYWRQIVFYKILLDADKRRNWNMTFGVMSFVAPGGSTEKFLNRKYIVQDEEIEKVSHQISETWEKIKNHEFKKGCNEDDCIWCEFVKNEYVFSDEVLEIEEEFEN